jgi:hypothetical protein
MPTDIDPLLIKQRVTEQFIAHGYSRINRRGEEVVDDTLMKARVYDAVKKKVARKKEEVSRNSYTNGELYALVFPNAPGTTAKALRGIDDLGAEIRRSLMRKVWGLTQPRLTGYIQRRLGADGLNLVLCRTSSTRDLDDAEVCFVTDDEDLIMSESVLPQIETLVRKADDLRLHTDMVLNRQPELQTRINRELGIGVRRVTAALPNASRNGATPEADDLFEH